MRGVARFAGLAFAAMGIAWPMQSVLAQEGYPTKPVRIIAPYPPGGTTDLLCRLIAQKFGAALGRQFVVENRPGAAGTIGHEVGARAAGDGYTIVLTTKGAMVVNPLLYKRRAFDPIGDFAHITVVISAGPVLTVHPSVPARSVKELVALGKAQPGRLNYGSGGIGTTAHIDGEFLQSITGAKFVHVPYKGGAVALNDLVAGQTDFQFGDMVPSVPMIQSGRLRALAVTTLQRSKVLPGVMTMVEAGIKEPFPSQWWGIIAPKGTPAAIINRLNAEWAKIITQPDVIQRFDELGVVAEHTTPEKMLEIIKAEGPPVAKLLRAAGIEPH